MHRRQSPLKVYCNPTHPQVDIFLNNKVWVLCCVQTNVINRLKQLIIVRFTPNTSTIEREDPNHVRTARYCCPVCRRTLTDAVKVSLPYHTMVLQAQPVCAIILLPILSTQAKLFNPQLPKLPPHAF
jgi:hypothetical protein